MAETIRAAVRAGLTPQEIKLALLNAMAKVELEVNGALMPDHIEQSVANFT